MRSIEIVAPYNRLSRDQLITVGDLVDFKAEMLSELARLLKEHVSPPSKKWLKSSEVRKMLGISGGTLQAMRVNGSLPFSKVGGLFFYPSQDIEKFMLASSSK
ncbi:MAG TPA: helix-turn-helix domain-containing protein [Chryseolinea sp.]